MIYDSDISNLQTKKIQLLLVPFPVLNLVLHLVDFFQAIHMSFINIQKQSWNSHYNLG